MASSQYYSQHIYKMWKLRVPAHSLRTRLGGNYTPAHSLRTRLGGKPHTNTISLYLYLGKFPNHSTLYCASDTCILVCHMCFLLSVQTHVQVQVKVCNVSTMNYYQDFPLSYNYNYVTKPYQNIHLKSNTWKHSTIPKFCSVLYILPMWWIVLR